jgi:hypothetical protein
VTTAEAFRDLTCQLDELNRTSNAKPAFILAELNDLLTAAAGNQFESLPGSSAGSAGRMADPEDSRS